MITLPGFYLCKDKNNFALITHIEPVETGNEFPVHGWLVDTNVNRNEVRRYLWRRDGSNDTTEAYRDLGERISSVEARDTIYPNPNIPHALHKMADADWKFFK